MIKEKINCDGCDKRVYQESTNRGIDDNPDHFYDTIIINDGKIEITYESCMDCTLKVKKIFN